MIFEAVDKVKEFYKHNAIRCRFGVRVTEVPAKDKTMSYA